MNLTRRQTLLAGAALPLAAAPNLTLADGHAATSLPTHRDFTLGDFKVTTLLVGSRSVENPHSIFGLNVDDEVDGVPIGRRRRWLRGVGPVDAGLAMNVFGGNQRAHHRAITAGVYRDLRTARQFGHHQGVAGGELQRHIAGHGGDTEHVEVVGRCQRQQEGDSVVLAGIGVDDDASRHARMLGGNASRSLGRQLFELLRSSMTWG